MTTPISGYSGGDAMPWWKEPSKDQWVAYVAAWLGGTLDAFDFTIFLLIMAMRRTRAARRSVFPRKCEPRWCILWACTT